MPHAHHGPAVPERMRRLRRKGVEDWFYTGMGITCGDPLGYRAFGWVSWKYQARSWTIWEFDFNSLRARMYPEAYSERNGEILNGEGALGRFRMGDLIQELSDDLPK